MVQDALSGAQRLIHQDAAHCVREGEGQLVRLRVAQADSQAALRVAVNQQHFLSGLRQSNPQVGTGGRFADAALLVGNGDDLCVQRISPRFCLSCSVLEIEKAATSFDKKE